jgi:hypothetical protein
MSQQSVFSSRTLRLRSLAAAFALAATAVSSHATIEVFNSGTSFFKRVITNTSATLLNAATFTSPATTFATVPGATTTIFVPASSSVLVSVDFSAEAACYGGGVGNPDWCELMVMIGGVEGSPQASTTSFGDLYAFASTDAGNATYASWRGHAMSRHRCIRNASTAPMAVPVAIQWRILKFGTAAGTPATEFWLDDSAMVIQMSTGCTVSGAPAATDGVAPAPGEGQGARSERR